MQSTPAGVGHNAEQEAIECNASVYGQEAQVEHAGH